MGCFFRLLFKNKNLSSIFVYHVSHSRGYIFFLAPWPSEISVSDCNQNKVKGLWMFQEYHHLRNRKPQNSVDLIVSMNVVLAFKITVIFHELKNMRKWSWEKEMYHLAGGLRMICRQRSWSRYEYGVRGKGRISELWKSAKYKKMS